MSACAIDEGRPSARSGGSVPACAAAVADSDTADPTPPLVAGGGSATSSANSSLSEATATMPLGRLALANNTLLIASLTARDKVIEWIASQD